MENRSSIVKKTCLYIGHEYHIKTNSTRFLIDLLAEQYSSETMTYDMQNPNMDKIIYEKIVFQDYDIVVFFQFIICKKYLKQLQKKNIIFVPMFDHLHFESLSYWKHFRGVRIINFSETLNAKLCKWGHYCLSMKYFPALNEFKEGDVNKVFFWQRLTKFNINVIEKILGDYACTLYFHKALDPGEEFIQPTREQEEKYSISYSEWFDNKEELDKLIASCGIYIAPREFEGIGLSFLQAMGMGKCVIAHEEPTMSEYIEPGKTGLLINFDDPEKPQLKDIATLEDIKRMQKETYKYMEEGYKEWERRKYEIIDFINMPTTKFRQRSHIKVLIYYYDKIFVLKSLNVIGKKIIIWLYLMIKQIMPYGVLKFVKRVPEPVNEKILLDFLPYRIVRMLQKEIK